MSNLEYFISFQRYLNHFEIDPNQYKFDHQSLQKMRDDFTKIYAVTDEKYNKEQFNKLVKKENQIITKGIEVEDR